MKKCTNEQPNKYPLFQYYKRKLSLMMSHSCIFHVSPISLKRNKIYPINIYFLLLCLLFKYLLIQPTQTRKKDGFPKQTDCTSISSIRETCVFDTKYVVYLSEIIRGWKDGKVKQSSDTIPQKKKYFPYFYFILDCKQKKQMRK